MKYCKMYVMRFLGVSAIARLPLFPKITAYFCRQLPLFLVDMKILLALDSFKGCLTSVEVEAAIGDALAAAGHTVTAVPMSDGGDGMLSAFASALDARVESVRVHDPLMRRVDACYAIAPDGTAVIETAKACGLCHLKPEERNPMTATTFGVGELVAHALLSGCRKFVIGLGGSGTSDAGIGMLKGLTAILKPGCDFDTLYGERLSGCSFVLASDVRNPLCGENGAAAVFGPQKGADEEMVRRLDLRARRFAEVSARHFGRDMSSYPGAGAAGGLGYAFLQYLNASVRSGADLLFEFAGLGKLIADSDIVITGEGRADRQTLMGKLPERVLAHARKAGVPVWLLCGSVADEDALHVAGFEKVYAVTPAGTPLDEAIRPDVARRNIVACCERLLRAE